MCVPVLFYTLYIYTSPPPYDARRIYIVIREVPERILHARRNCAAYAAPG